MNGFKVQLNVSWSRRHAQVLVSDANGLILAESFGADDRETFLHDVQATILEYGHVQVNAL
jgi:hypothetical protein